MTVADLPYKQQARTPPSPTCSTAARSPTDSKTPRLTLMDRRGEGVPGHPRPQHEAVRQEPPLRTVRRTKLRLTIFAASPGTVPVGRDMDFVV